jgi:hypothetical protein
MRTWLLLPWLLLPLAAGAQGLYKWVDDKGVVHYSDKPPAGKSGQKLNVAPQPPLENKEPQRSRSWQEQLQDSNERRFQDEKKQKEAEQKSREAAEKCQRARYALDSLKQERPLYRVNQQGERVFMEDEERRRLVEGWQQQADAYCKLGYA